ncbi:TrkH family potassium uptake protein, partial [Thermodesulfobacteriota bacterium]
MHWGQTLSVVGIMLVFLGLSLLLPLGVGLYYGDASVVPIAQSMGITLAAGSVLYLLTRKHMKETLSHREGMAIVSLVWAGAGLFGALPFYLGDVFPSFADAVFESVSGFTTTGSSLLSDITKRTGGHR